MDKLKMETSDMAAENIEKIGALFPSAVTEMRGEDGSIKKGVNFEMLKQLLSPDVVEEGDERYEFTWVGKKQAIAEAARPTTKTLRPVKEDSRNWDATENLYIEGDNLEVLKILQESYLGKVKMIYIDPPYNTGHDFIYRDDFGITYNRLDAAYDQDVFTRATLRGKLDVNAMEANRSLYSHVIYDSDNERRFAQELDVSDQVAVYVKLPGSFYISTPVGKYNPDWAIAFNEGSVKHIYFVAETKGNLDTMELRGVENAKIECAKKHFAAISNGSVVYSVVDNYSTLMQLVSN